MQTGLVSVIIPVFNGERFLDRCMESITNQSYQNLQIILVDDGSWDSSPARCDAWAARDSRVMVIHKSNEGAGLARNTGIEQATGEYICFFDCDDYASEYLVEKCFLQARKQDADVVIFGFTTVDHTGRVIQTKIPSPPKDAFKGASVQTEFLPLLVAPPVGMGFNMSLWTGFYSADLIRRSGWRLESERKIFSEDFYSLLKLYRYVTSVSILPEALYCYCMHMNSLSHSLRTKAYEPILHLYRECIKVCTASGYNEAVRSAVSRPYLAFTIGFLKQCASAADPFSERMQMIKSIISDETLQQVLKEKGYGIVSISRKVLFALMRCRLYFLCYLLLKIKS